MMSKKPIKKALEIKRINVTHHDDERSRTLTELKQFQEFFDWLTEDRQLKICNALRKHRKQFNPGDSGETQFDFFAENGEEVTVVMEWSIVCVLGKMPITFEAEFNPNNEINKLYAERKGEPS